MRTRKSRDVRLVPKTIDGKTHRVPRTVETEVPVVPRDWDKIGLRAVQVLAVVTVLGAVSWSTVSIGDLLSRVAPSWAAYTVAGVFDASWIACMILEWLSRYDPERASLPRRAGHVALLTSMGMIALHGHVLGLLEVGIGGALVSALAKGLWTVVMRFTRVDLDPDAAAWLKAEQMEINARLGLTAGRRMLVRAEDKIAAEQLALGHRRPPVPETLSLQGQPRETRTRDTEDVVHLVTSKPATVSSFVLDKLRDNGDMSLGDIRDAVHDVFGDTKEDTVKKAVSRSRRTLRDEEASRQSRALINDEGE